mgnify:CR=1 FL=1
MRVVVAECLTLGDAELLAHHVAGERHVAAFALHEDRNAQDSLAESWARPFGPAEVAPGITLEAQLGETWKPAALIEQLVAEMEDRYERMRVVGPLLRLSSGRDPGPRSAAVGGSPCTYLMLHRSAASPALTLCTCTQPP